MKKFILLIIFYAVTFSGHTQDSQPQATPSNEDMYTWSQQLFFPQQVNFSLLAKVPEAEVAELDLVISYRGVESLIIPVEPTIVPDITSGGLIEYTWLIPGDPLPPLFGTIRYQWNITTTEGRLINLSGSFLFQDDRVEWVQSNDMTAQVNIYHGRDQFEPERVRQGIRATYDLLFQDIANPPIYNLVVYPSNVPAGCAVNTEGEPIIRISTREGIEAVECNLDLAERIFDNDEWLVFSESSVDSIQRTLIALLVEVYYEEQWGTDIDIPDWFLYGLQEFYDPRPNSEMLVLAQRASRTNDLLSFRDLATKPEEDEPSIDLWEAQSAGLVIYFADTLGVDGLIEFANNLDQYDNFDEAYEEVFDQDPDLLLLLWQDWLFLSSTAQDYTYQPYLPDTPTPSVTPTATNTPTPTFTPSSTPNVTSTPRPTSTPIPPTATITPLPAQSFSVQPTSAPPTAVPDIPASTEVADDGLLTRGLIGGSVILILVMILIFVLRTR